MDAIDTRQEALRELRARARQLGLTKEDLQRLAAEYDVPGADSEEAMYESSSPPSAQASKHRGKKHIGVAEVLYIVGSSIIIVGVAILVGQNWERLTGAVRILLTLGTGVVAYLVGGFLTRKRTPKTLVTGIFLIGMVLMLFGLGVSFHQAGFDMSRAGVWSVIFTVMLFVSIFSLLVVSRELLFLLFTIAFATALFFSVSNFLVDPVIAPEWMARFWWYRIFAAGSAYVVLGYALRTTAYARLRQPLYLFGSAGVLLAGLVLGGYNPNQSVFWEIVYPGIAFAILFLGVPLRSMALLGVGTVGVIAYIFKLTAEYFSQSIGWPSALVIAGIALMAIGYLAYMLNRRYLHKPVGQ